MARPSEAWVAERVWMRIAGRRREEEGRCGWRKGRRDGRRWRGIAVVAGEMVKVMAGAVLWGGHMCCALTAQRPLGSERQ